MDNASDEADNRAPILAKDTLRRWQKSLLEVRDLLCAVCTVAHNFLYGAAPIARGVPQAADRVPCSRAHERGRYGAGMDDRQCGW